jgi:phenylacetyl-CoA:acceptor oxidoreductase subunit 2
VNTALSAPITATRQRYWDWRAAGNFTLGGSGAGVLIYAAAGSGAGLLDLLGAALITVGLLGVWSEIGRPWRAMNAFRRASTSWMSREMIVAPLVLAGALAAAWLDLSWLRWLAAGFAVVYLYAQARMLNAGRGIPAWRNPWIVPLLMATGLAEGAGIGIFAGWVVGSMAPPPWPALLLAVFLSARAIAFSRYRRALPKTGAPQRALRASSRLGRLLSELDALAIALAIASAFGVGRLPLVLVSALIAAGAGWWLKYTLVIRLSYKQAFALPVRPAEEGPASAAPPRG